MAFGGQTHVGPENHLLDGGPDSSVAVHTLGDMYLTTLGQWMHPILAICPSSLDATTSAQQEHHATAMMLHGLLLSLL